MFKRTWQFLLDTLFPPNERERAVRELTAEKFAEKLMYKEQSGVLALFSYRDPLIKQMIWMLKYRGDRHVARLFAGVLYDVLMEEYADAAVFSEQPPVLIPLPLSRRRKRERGFNQMELVASELQRLGDFPIATRVLTRTRHSKPQTSIKNRDERRENIKGVFSVADTGACKDTDFIVIDDVSTTGATLEEARKTLLSAGARKVTCIALAH